MILMETTKSGLPGLQPLTGMAMQRSDQATQCEGLLRPAGAQPLPGQQNQQKHKLAYAGAAPRDAFQSRWRFQSNARGV